MTENVDHPQHYNNVKGMPEVWDILDAFFVDRPHLWQVGKYILRAGKKGSELEDLRKAQQYLQRRIEVLECKDNPDTTGCEEYLWGYKR